MKITEIKTDEYGREVAYMFDEEQGKLYKVLVEDMTGDTEPVRRKPVMVRKKVRPVPPVEEEYDEEDDGPPINVYAQDTEALKDHKPAKIPRSIMPPGMAGVFRKPDMPGAAVERRDTQ